MILIRHASLCYALLMLCFAYYTYSYSSCKFCYVLLTIVILIRHECLCNALLMLCFAYYSYSYSSCKFMLCFSYYSYSYASWKYMQSIAYATFCLCYRNSRCHQNQHNVLMSTTELQCPIPILLANYWHTPVKLSFSVVYILFSWIFVLKRYAFN